MEPKNRIFAAVVLGLLTVIVLLAVLGLNKDNSAYAQVGSGGPGQAESGNPLNPEDLALPPAMDTGGDLEEVQAATRYLHVSGSTFEQLYSSADVFYGGSGCVYLTGSNMYLVAPLELPYESTVNTLRLYYKDTSAQDGYMWLAQYDDGLSYTYVVTATTTGTAGWGTRTVNFEKKLDYVNYSYAIMWSPNGVAGSAMQLCGYRIGYIASFPANALPVVIK